MQLQMPIPLICIEQINQIIIQSIHPLPASQKLAIHKMLLTSLSPLNVICAKRSNPKRLAFHPFLNSIQFSPVQSSPVLLHSIQFLAIALEHA
mmetsp:Transcript_20788/g.30464  ORF Transcript_20788/g.30464 Transcript_20788/m.30464 type:complete len:93 (+) Transcript_20788:157-435(+)